MDGHTNKILKNISVPGILDPDNPNYNPLIAINPNTNRLYVDDNSGLNIMYTSTNKIIGSIKEINGSNSIAVNSNTNKIYAYKILSGNTTSNEMDCRLMTSKLYELDGSTNKIINTLQLNNITLNQVDVNPLTNKLYLLGSTCSTEGYFHGSEISLLFVVKPSNEEK